jgi:hypothetical protein
MGLLGALYTDSHLKVTGSNLQVADAQVEVGITLSRLKIPSEPKACQAADFFRQCICRWRSLKPIMKQLSRFVRWHSFLTTETSPRRSHRKTQMRLPHTRTLDLVRARIIVAFHMDYLKS